MSGWGVLEDRKKVNITFVCGVYHTPAHINHLHCSINAAVGDEATNCLPTKFMMFTNVELRLGSSSTPLGMV